MKALDLVRTPKGGLALVTEVGYKRTCSLHYLRGFNPGNEYNAWWDPKELLLVDSLPHLLANALAHSGGNNTKQGDRDFPVM